MSQEEEDGPEQSFFNAGIFKQYGFSDRIPRDEGDAEGQRQTRKSYSGSQQQKQPSSAPDIDLEEQEKDDLFIENDLSDEENAPQQKHSRQGATDENPKQTKPSPAQKRRSQQLEQPETTEETSEIKSQRIDLHDWCTYLGEYSSRWNPETGKQEPEFIRNPDCILSLKKIRKYLAEDLDNDKARVARWLGEWRIVEQKLLPLMAKYEEDKEVFLRCIHIMWALTRSVDDNEAGTPISKRYRQEVLDYQRRFKRQIASHSDVIKLLTKLLFEPLRVRKEREASRYSEARGQDTLEQRRFDREKLDSGELDDNALLTLSLVNHLLLIPDTPGDPAPSTALITSMEAYGIFDVMRGLAQQLNSERYSSKYSAYVFPLLEFYYALFGMVAPELVVKASEAETRARERKQQNLKNRKTPSSKNAAQQSVDNTDPLIALRTQEKRNKQMRGETGSSSRHPKFSGSYAVMHKNSRQVFSDAFHVQNPEEKLSTNARRKPHKARKKKQDNSICPGGMVHYLQPDALGAYELEAMAMGEDPRFEILTVLYRAADAFIAGETDEVDEDAFAPVTSCFAHLIRACAKTIAYGSGVTERDRLRFLRVMSFGIGFSRWQSFSITDQLNFHPGDVRVTLDRFTFTVVLTAMENYKTWKQFDATKVAVTALKEMVALLMALFQSQHPMSQTLAFALETSVLGEREVIDSIPPLLRQWDPEKSDHDYERILIELCYFMRKTAAQLVERGTKIRKKNRIKQRSNENEEDIAERNERERERQEEVGMDMDQYLKQFVHNNVVRLHIAALWRYQSNGLRVNNYILDFMEQLASFKDSTKSLASAYSCEPMLWHFSFIDLLPQALSDSFIKSNPDYRALLDFMRSQTRHIMRFLKKKPLIMAEMLFWREKQINRLIANDYKPLELVERREKKKSKAQLAREEAEREAYLNKLANEENDSEYEFSEANAAELDGGMIIDPEAKKKNSNKKSKKRLWTEEEEKKLAELYKKYCDLDSCFDLIASEEPFQQTAKGTAQLRQRARKLGLIGKKKRSSTTTKGNKRSASALTFDIEQVRRCLDTLRQDNNISWSSVREWLLEQLKRMLKIIRVTVPSDEECANNTNALTSRLLDTEEYKNAIGVGLPLVPLSDEHFGWVKSPAVKELLDSIGFAKGEWLYCCNVMVPIYHLLRSYVIIHSDCEQSTTSSPQKNRRRNNLVIEDSDSE
eukprot:gb/GECG01003479.1/.p1 GENE.gb/GECG01003479.1/~~gb/GECG01003479.1/.p1  ORF type:complete len:1203 (+),score=204.67 gb/GECG01003479.1/:1-3609(+)